MINSPNLDYHEGLGVVFLWQSDCIALFEMLRPDWAGCKPLATEVHSRFMLNSGF